jgi:hypothetical protein
LIIELNERYGILSTEKIAITEKSSTQIKKATHITEAVRWL